MIYIIDCGSKKVKEIKRMIKELEQDFDVVKIEDVAKHKFSEARAFVISGSPTLLTGCDQTKIDEYKARINQLTDLDKPILGICFGHQILGLHFGSKVSLCKEDRLFQRIQQKMKDELFEELPFPTVSLKEDHTECISLPPNFTLLAGSTTCEVEAMKHFYKPWYGVQFHPETSGKHGFQLMQNFLQILSAYEFAQAQENGKTKKASIKLIQKKKK